MLQWIVWAIAALVIGGIASWIARPRPGVSAALGAAGCLAAAVLGLHGALGLLLAGNLESRRLVWNLPYTTMNVGADSLTALFLIPLFLVGAVVALHAVRRTPGEYAANRPHEHWLFLNFTLAGAALALVARNAVVFLAAWEIMTAASFLLIENDQRQPGGKGGGWVYLSAGHIGCAALFALFALLGAGRGTLDFASLEAATGTTASAAFLLACVGFGGKVGLAPLQTWYPEAYPAAPAHVGAILSGVVGNMGIYGLLRTLSILGGGGKTPPEWWGYVLVFAGLASGIIGAARSLASRDLSRLLAWSSVENYGLMAAGIGLGLLGAADHNSVVSFLGFAAAILHMGSHAVSKALLFLAAGSVYARTGTRNLDQTGGLLKRLPATGGLFLVGALGAASVPPLNGFIGEFLLLMSAFTGAGRYHSQSVAAVAMFLFIVVLAVIGGLAAAAYLKAFGFVFLGNPRGAGAASSSPERRRGLLPHALLAAAALALAALSPWALAAVAPAASRLVDLWREQESGDLALWLSSDGPRVLDSVFAGCWLLAGCVAAVYLLRRVFTSGKKSASAPTWDCGYAAPDNRMQYTASSFVRPVAESFNVLVSLEDKETPPKGYFPSGASFESATPGVEKAWGFSHLFKYVAWLAAKIRVTQAGRVQIYLLYMAVALVVLLMWKL